MEHRISETISSEFCAFFYFTGMLRKNKEVNSSPHQRSSDFSFGKTGRNVYGYGIKYYGL